MRSCIKGKYFNLSTPHSSLIQSKHLKPSWIICSQFTIAHSKKPTKNLADKTENNRKFFISHKYGHTLLFSKLFQAMSFLNYLYISIDASELVLAELGFHGVIIQITVSTHHSNFPWEGVSDDKNSNQLNTSLCRKKRWNYYSGWENEFFLKKIKIFSLSHVLQDSMSNILPNNKEYAF